MSEASQLGRGLSFELWPLSKSYLVLVWAIKWTHDSLGFCGFNIFWRQSWIMSSCIVKMQKNNLQCVFAARWADVLLDIRNDMLAEVLRIVFHTFGQCKSAVDSRNRPNKGNQASFSFNFGHGCFPYLISGRSQTSDCILIGIFQKEPRFVLGQEIHKVLCLAILAYFKKMTWTSNSWDFSVRGELVWNPSKMNFLISSFSWRILEHISFETLRCLQNILHERKGRSRMSSAITHVKSELARLPDHGSSANSVLPCRKFVRNFFPAEIWRTSLPYTLVSSISISLALRPLRDKKQRTARSLIWHNFSGNFAPNEAPHNDAPYRLISVNCILLDTLFRKEYRYDATIPAFLIGEKHISSWVITGNYTILWSRMWHFHVCIQV
jgi:hypothetical protein